ncbi:MAG: indolepyruvate oxidoreductase subunit beta, partial [Clostridia bacterium]|nr:indolepyruvate oxidoreductase subunit beta [Clostridia bacterium]
GVGGQGTLLASRILGALARIHSFDSTLSEVQYISQRGGRVVTNVKIAPKVTSPIVGLKDAEISHASEKLEAIRYTNYLKDGGTIIVNNQEILPMPVITGAREYPEDIVGTLKERAGKVVAVDAYEIAESIGNPKGVNVVMLGALARSLDIPFSQIDEALKQAVKPKLYDINRVALLKGYEI